MPELPPEIITDILSRLPVRPLLRFRCVCKPWCALIDSSKFMKMHLNRSVQTRSNLSLILNSTEPRPYSIDFNSLDRAVELDHPLKSDKYGNLTQRWGSCNGLLCLVEPFLDTTREDVVLWNPSTRKHWRLPDAPIENGTRSFYCNYGFGFDTTTDDYKVLRIVIFYGAVDGQIYDVEVKVYSLKLNSWKRILDFPNYLAQAYEPGRFVGGALHWVVTVTRRRDEFTEECFGTVLAFDLGAEGFQIVPQPEYKDINFSLNIGDLEGCLCVICTYKQVASDIWVMKQYGVKESWTKLISIKLSDVVRSFANLKPIAYSKNGGKLLIQHDNNKFSWYDMKRKIMESVNIHDLPDRFMTTVCWGSLVPPGGVVGKKQEAAKDKTKKKNNPKKRDDFLSKGFKLML